MKLHLQKNIYPGKIIVFTGIDGSGKTTLINKAEKYLLSKNKDCMRVRMPSDRIRQLTAFRNFHDSKDEKVRNSVDLFSLTVLVSGDRLMTLHEEVIPALKEGKCVLCDRYCFTGNVRCSDEIITRISERFINPDLTILATADVETLKKRVLSRENEKDLFYDDEGVKKQYNEYLSLAKDNGFQIIDTTKNQDEIDCSLYSKLDFVFENI